jgi:hypothetical protein
LAAIVRRRALATAAVKPTCVTIIRARTWSAAVGGASIRGDGVLHSDNVDVCVVGKQRNLLRDKGLHREQQVVVVAPKRSGSASHSCLERGSDARSSIHAVMQKVPRSARLAVSEPSRSTQPEEPKIVFAVPMLHAIGGTPTTSR